VVLFLAKGVRQLESRDEVEIARLSREIEQLKANGEADRVQWSARAEADYREIVSLVKERDEYYEAKKERDLYHRLMLESNKERCYFQKSFYTLKEAARSVIAMSEAAQELEDFHRAKYTLLNVAGNLMDLALKATEFGSPRKVDGE
jgi:hypothetical protein